MIFRIKVEGRYKGFIVQDSSACFYIFVHSVFMVTTHASNWCNSTIHPPVLCRVSPSGSVVLEKVYVQSRVLQRTKLMAVHVNKIHAHASHN